MEVENAGVKDFKIKVGAKKVRLTIVAALTPALARVLKVHSVLFMQDNMPKQEIEEIKLKILKSGPFDFRLEVPNIANIADVLILPSCDEAKDWVARMRGSSKKGKASKLFVEFKVCYTGSSVGIVEWLEKYGQAPGMLTLKSSGPQQQDLKGEDVAAAAEAAQKAAGKGKANGAAAGSTTVVQ